MISFSRNVSFYLPGIRRFQNIQTSNICHWENQARNNSSKTSDRTETYKRTNVVYHVRHVIYFNELLLTFRDRWPSLFIEAVRWKGRGGEGKVCSQAYFSPVFVTSVVLLVSKWKLGNDFHNLSCRNKIFHFFGKPGLLGKQKKRIFTYLMSP